MNTKWKDAGIYLNVYKKWKARRSNELKCAAGTIGTQGPEIRAYLSNSDPFSEDRF